MEYIIAIFGFVAGCLFTAYRLRGDRTFGEAVADVVRLGGPTTKPPAR